MDDKEKRRLNKQFAITWFLLLLTMFAVLYVTAANPRTETHNFVGQQGPKGDSIVGPIGQPGESIRGKDGRDGVDGKTTIIENSTTIYRTETIRGEKGDVGEKGAPGEKGQDAPTLQVQVNPETKDLEYKYSTDTFWTVLVTCNQFMRECDGTVTE